MSFDRERRGDGDQVRAERGRQVGKQTRTKDLPSPGRPAGAVQRLPAALTTNADHADRAVRDDQAHTWMAQAVRPDLPAPVQRRRVGAASDAATMHAAARHGISGSVGALPHLGAIQASFGRHDVGHIAAHVDGVAREASRAMGAQAYATGDHVAFGASPDLHTAAHEAAHVVQQRAGVHLKDAIGSTGDIYERHADAVADKVVRGESAEGLLDQMCSGGGGGGAALQLLTTSGGEFDISDYTPYNEDSLRGTFAEITFTPNDLVIAPKIGFTQTLKATKGGASYCDLGRPLEAAERRGRANTPPQGDVGRHIDRGGERTNPMYGLDDPLAGTGIEGTTTSGDNAIIGYRNVDDTGHVDIRDAWMADRAAMHWQAGVAMEQVFETSALVMAGAMAGTYLGSVEWGVKTDAATGTPTPMPFRVISQGVPTQQFMASAANWNAQRMWQSGRVVAVGPGTVASRAALVPGMRYPAGTLMMTITPASRARSRSRPPAVEVRTPIDATFDSFLVDVGARVSASQELAVYRTQQASVDLPITDHRTVDPATLGDKALETRMRLLNDEVMSMDRTTTDYQNKRFEIRALGRAAELRGRKVIDSGHTYTRESTDTLWSIAAAHLGDGALWTRIVALNVADLGGANGIPVGATLRMPVPYHPASRPAPTRDKKRKEHDPRKFSAGKADPAAEKKPRPDDQASQ